MRPTFIITDDHIAEPGETRADSDPKDGDEYRYPEVFTLHDDDGEKYFTGRMLADQDVRADELDPWIDALEWGMWYAGCTNIRDSAGRVVVG